MNLKSYILLVILLIIQVDVSAQNANWSPVLPTKFPTNASGQIHGISRVSQLKFHPTNSNKLYAVSARGGIFISNDGGTNWTVTPGTDNMPSSRMASICIDYTNDQILYLGSGDHNYYSTGTGLWKSTNGGQTFALTTLTAKIVVEIIMDPTDHNIIVAATNTGIYKSINGGSTWTLKTTSRQFDDLKQKTPVSRVLYAATTDSAFFRSLDFGDTWLQINNGIVLPSGITNGNGCRIAITQADTNIVYLGMVANGGMIYKSTDAGNTFTPIKTAASPYLTYYSNDPTSSGQGDYNFGIGADRVDPNILYLVAHNVWKSTDGGITWVQLTNWWLKVHTDMHQIITSPHNNGQLWNMNDGGVWLSTDGGNNWSPKSDGIYGYEIYHGNCSPTRKDMFSIGTQDNGELYANSSGWFTNRGGDWGSQCAFDYRPNSSMVYYFQNNKRRLVNGSDASYGLPAQVTMLQDIAFHRSNPNLAFVADTIIYRTNNLLATTPTWTQIANFNKKIMAMHSSIADTNYLYVITNDGLIYVSTNALSITPTFTSYTLPNTTNNKANITSIKSSPNVIYITCNTKAYKSINNGLSWTNITYNLPPVNHIRMIADEYYSSSELVFVASNNTVYYKIGAATTWTNFNTNLPSRTDAIDLSIFNDSTPNTSLRLATYGRGMWETPINTIRTLSANFTADNFYPCVGSSVQFTDISLGNVSSRVWSFPGGTPSTSTATNPIITYNSSGNYLVSLTISNGASNTTLTQSNYISTSGTSLNLAENFEGITDPPLGWKNIDSGTSGYLWAKINYAGGFGTSSSSMMYDNYSWNIQGQKDELRIKTLNLTGYAGVKLYFDVAYQVYSGYADSLVVRISTDCGLNFTTIYSKGGIGLSTAGTASSDFIPTAAQWRTDTVDLSAYAGLPGVIIEFQNVNGYGNNIFLDNINIIENCIAPTIPIINASVNPLCNGSNSILSIQSGQLNSATNWKWYPTACGSGPGISANAVSVSPTSTSTYYVRGEGGCVLPGICSSITITVNNPQTWYLDNDVDGYYSGIGVSNCNSPGTGYTTTIISGNDCNDSLPLIHPGANELCGNYLDDNCNTIVDEGCNITLNLKVYIQGLYNIGSQMTSPINDINLPSICDTITIELHQAIPQFGLVYSFTNTIDRSGNGQFILPSTVWNNSYYLVVRHRNSIETWSKIPILFNGSNVYFDFTTP